MKRRPPRVLFVECINADQFPGQICGDIPAYRGWLEAQGAETHTLRFGLSTTHLYEHRSDAVVLGEEEEARLLERCDAFQPGLIACTHELASPHRDRLRARLEDLAIVSVDEVLDRFHGDPARSDRSLAPTEILDFVRAGVRPRYRWEAGNVAAARPDRNNVYLTLRANCGYRGGVAHNPRYAGLALAPRTRLSGCAFCGAWGAEEERGARTPPEWIARQVAAIAEDLEGPRRPHALLLEQIEDGGVLRAAIDAALAHDLGDVPLLLGIRSDQLVRHAEALGEYLRGARGPCPPLAIFSMGLESFDDENLRVLNKGTTGLVNLRAVRALRELARLSGGRFTASGLSVLLLTPWSTPAQLHLDLGTIRHLDLAGRVGNVYQSRLRLHPDLAITQLAAHEGLVVDQESDSALPMSRRKLFREERAWRPSDPRLRRFERLLLRLHREDALDEEDTLHQQLRALLADRDRFVGADLDAREPMAEHDLELALAILEEATAGGSEDEGGDALAGLARRAFARWTRQRAARLRARERFRLGEESLPAEGWLARVAPLLREGDKPALSLRLRARDLTAARAAIAAAGLHGEALDETDGALIVASATPETTAALVALERAGGGDPEDVTTIRALGLAYGYPPCCVEAWCARPSHARGDTQWAAVALRTDHPGPIPAATAPPLIPELAFVPCTPDCATAEARYRRWHARLLPGVLAALEAGALALVGLPGGHAEEELVLLQTLAEEGDSLRHDPRSLAPGGGPLRSALRAAEDLRLGPGQVQVGDTALWTATVFPWSARRSWHAEHWHELALTAQEPAWIASRGAWALSLPGGQGERRESGIAQDPRSLRLVFTPRESGTPLVFFLGPLEEGERAFARVGATGLVHPPDQDVTALEACAAPLLEAMRAVGAPPSDGNLPAWREALRAALRRSGLLRRYHCQVAQVGVALTRDQKPTPADTP